MRRCQRLVSRSPAPCRNRSKLPPFQPTGPRRTLPSAQFAKRADTSPTSWASRSLTSTSTSPATTTPRTATPTKAAVASVAVLSPEIVKRKTATTGNERLSNWFQRLVRVTPRAISRVAKPQPRNIPNAAAAPAAGPPGTTKERAVDACVSRSAERNERPGSTTIQGGANVAIFTVSTTSRAAIHCQESVLTTAQTSP